MPSQRGREVSHCGRLPSDIAGCVIHENTKARKASHCSRSGVFFESAILDSIGVGGVNASQAMESKDPSDINAVALRVI